MSTRFDKAKIVAEILKLGAEVYAMVVDKDLAKKNLARDVKIAELEKQIADLKAKAT